MNWLSFIGLRMPCTPRPRGRCDDTAVRRRRARLGLETLEDRCVPAVFNVMGTADGLGAVTLTAPGVFNAHSLRSAIQAANATPGGNTINLTVAGTYNITRAPTTPNEADNAAGEFAILPTGGDLTIQNTSGGAVTVNGNHLSRVFDINPADSTDPAAQFMVTFLGFTIQNGVAFDPNSPVGPTSSGGGIRDQGIASLTLNNMFVTNNTARADGGGIYFSGTTVTINNTELQGNSTGGSGGALFVGGPVTSSGTTASVLTLTNSTVAGNTAGTGGGGIELETTGTGSIISNVTITGNSALNNAGTNGGGIDAPDTFTGSVTLDSDTINANFATLGGGIFWASEAHSTFAIQNTIVALNTASIGGDIDSSLNETDNGGNLIGNISTALFTRTSGLDPLLGPLQDNGGPLVGSPGTQQVVQTEALLAGSTAIGAGSPGAPTTDERGFNRVNGRIDSGAFEFQALTSALTMTASPSPAQLGSPVTFKATVSSQTPGTNAVPTGNVTFTIDGVPQAPVTLNNGVANLTLPSLPVGAHTVTAAYAGDSNFSTSTGTGTLTVVDPAISSGRGTALTATGTTTQPTAPVGGLSLFALGLGPTGFDLFQVDSQGDVFAQSLSGGGLQFVAPSLQLRLALLSKEGILALLAGSNGQDYIIDVFDPFLPSIEPAVLAVL